MMRNTDLKILCMAGLFAMLSPDGQAANPVGNISISPSSPTGAWSCTLKPNESASLTICVAPEGVVRGVRYVLKGDPVYPVLGQTEDFLWYGSAGNYAICNLKGETATAGVMRLLERDLPL